MYLTNIISSGIKAFSFKTDILPNKKRVASLMLHISFPSSYYYSKPLLHTLYGFPFRSNHCFVFLFYHSVNESIVKSLEINLVKKIVTLMHCKD